MNFAASADPGLARHREAGRRPRRAAALAVAAALLAGGCAAGQVAQTADQKSSIDGTNAEIGNLALRAVAIRPPGSGLSAYPAGTDAALKIVIVNKGTRSDTLTAVRTKAASSYAIYADAAEAESVEQATLESVTGSSAASPSAEPSSSGSASSGSTTRVAIAPGSRRSFGTPDAEGGLLLVGLSSKLFPGDSISLTLTFATAGTITIDVPVQLSDSPRGPTVGGGEEDGSE